MTRELELTSPVLDLTFDIAGWSRNKVMLVFGVWMSIWIIISIGIIYAFAFPFAEWVGFEKAVLIGIAMMVMK